VALTKVTWLALVPPKVAVAPLWNIRPEMATVVPPPTVPELGETLLIVGMEM
jgi:hypothetical protein